MASQSFFDSISCLSETDKNRMICVLLHSTLHNSNIDWDTAAAAFGANSKVSMRRVYDASRQKYREHNGISVAENEKMGNTTKAAKARNGVKRQQKGSETDDEEKKPVKQRKTSRANAKKSKVKSEAAVKEEPEEPADVLDGPNIV